jgi:hypothetical protein
MTREWLRLRQLIEHLRTRLRWIPEAVVLALAALIVGGVLAATAVGAKWTDIFRSQAINIVSVALLAGFAYLLFFLRFRRAELTRYLQRSQPSTPRLAHAEGPDPLGRTIVNELLDARPPRACLIKSPAAFEDSALLTDIAAQLAKKRRVPVVVDLAGEAGNASLPALTRDRFVIQLVGSSGDAANARRLYASLVNKEKVVALVKGLEQIGQGMPLASRRAALAALLEGSLAEQIPFVAGVREDLAPSISEVAAYRAPPMPDDKFVRYIGQRLQLGAVGPEGELTPLEQPFHAAFDEVEPTRDLALINLALNVLVRRVRAGQDSKNAVDSLFADRCVFRRHFGWMCDWALNIEPPEIPLVNSPAAIALAAIGREAHYQKEPELVWDDAARALDAEDRRRFAAGIASLSQRDVVTVSGSGGSRIIRFTDPMWFAFAGTVGLQLDPDFWRDLLQPGVPVATLNALTGSLMAFGRLERDEQAGAQGLDQVNAKQERSHRPSFIGVLRDVGVNDEANMTLEMILAVILALQADEAPLDLGAREGEVLDKSWAASNDLVKLRFVRLIDFSRDPALIDFLWRQVDYPRFDENSFRIRRAICTRLGSLGDPAWRELNQRWGELIHSADRGDLSTSSRNTLGWKRSENPLASLGWVLPGLLMTIKEDREAAYQLLGDLRAVQNPTPGLPRHIRSPDIGLEISLAEGFKAAAVEVFSKRSKAAAGGGLRRRSDDPKWWSQALSLLEASRSWTAQQALLQVLALAPREVSRRDVIRSWETSPGKHPFARETARLVGLFVDRHKLEGAAVLAENDIWFEAVDALEDGGVTLSAETHRLLGLSTLLINLAEWRLEEAGGGLPEKQAMQAREDVFTGIELPRCFRRSNYAATMFEVRCSGDRSCSFHLCGPGALIGVVEARRIFSRSFVQRAEATTDALPYTSRRLPRLARRVWWALTRRTRERLFVGKAFESVWRSLDRELQSREGTS